jgi:predicted dehydrogenase
MRFGVVGCGMIARFHARAMADTAGAELAGCWSHHRERAEQFAAEHGCEAFASLEALVTCPAVDAIAICTPSGAHLEPALLAAAAGKHLLVEKPLEISPERCDQIIAAADRAGVLLATVFQSRFAPVWQQLRAAVQRGDFGRIALGEAHVKWFRPQSYYDSAAWRGTWQLDGGGALMNQAIHSVDLLLWLMGPVRRVAALTSTFAHDRIEVEDVAVASLEFQSGALGSIIATTASHPGRDKRIELHGAEGSVIVEEDRVIHWSSREEKGSDTSSLRRLRDLESDPGELVSARFAGGSGAADPAGIHHALHAAQYADFVDAFRSGRPPQVDGREGRKSVALIATIYNSARQQRVLSVPE